MRICSMTIVGMTLMKIAAEAEAILVFKKKYMELTGYGTHPFKCLYFF